MWRQNWFGSELKIDPFFVQLKALLVGKNNIITSRALLTLTKILTFPTFFSNKETPFFS
jgi:hypothetical protein